MAAQTAGCTRQQIMQALRRVPFSAKAGQRRSTPGQLTSRRHINLPGVKVNLPSFTEKDRGDSTVGLEEGIDFLALSFVREAKDIALLRAWIDEKKSKVRIIAKIEDQSAIDNLDDSDRRVILAMAHRFLVMLAASLFEDPDLVATTLRHDFGNDPNIGDRRIANGDGLILHEHEDIGDLHRFPRCY